MCSTTPAANARRSIRKSPIYDIPGFPRIEAAELIVRLKAQAAPFRPVYHLGEQVQALDALSGGFWRVTTSKGTVPAGARRHHRRRRRRLRTQSPAARRHRSLRGQERLLLRHAARDFRGKRVVIAGGGDTAVDWAISLAEVASRVSVIHRRDKFRAAPESEARLKALAKAGRVDLVVPYQLHGLEGSDGQLKAVAVATLDGVLKRIEADMLLPFFGLSMSLGPIADWSLALEHNQIAVEPSTAATNKPGSSPSATSSPIPAS